MSETNDNFGHGDTDSIETVQEFIAKLSEDWTEKFTKQFTGLRLQLEGYHKLVKVQQQEIAALKGDIALLQERLTAIESGTSPQ